MIFHIDVNSAYLSWTAVALLEKGYPVDLREVPAVIAGDPKNRHGIILAKSIPAKEYGIKTGESLYQAMQKCKNLIVMPPDYDLYLACSEAMYEILLEYSPLIQRYSIDECFLDGTFISKNFDDGVKVAHQIKNRMKNELGFTVNIGVSVNKLLAKMGSELEKPNRVHTLWPDEIPQKLWPLPVGELFMVGSATRKKLEQINIRTIGDLAKSEPDHIKALLKSHGTLVWKYARGIDDSPVTLNDEIVQKGIGNSTTTSYDMVNRREALAVLLALTERTCQRMRRLGCMCSLVAVSIKTNLFWRCSHQMQLPSHTNSTSKIYKYGVKLFDEMWRKVPLRQIGIRVFGLERDQQVQLSFFHGTDVVQEERLDQAIDCIRKKYGDTSIMRGRFANTHVAPLQGGVNDGTYINLGGYQT